MKTYILQKDLPDVKAEAEFKEEVDCYRYDFPPESSNFRKVFVAYAKDFVENNPFWFKLKENKFDIQLLVDIDSSKGSEEELLQLVKLWDKFRVQFK